MSTKHNCDNDNIDNIINELSEKINKLSKKIDNIDEKIDKLINNSEKISRETQRMDSHVTFVEDIYNKVKSPFHFLMNKISYLPLQNNYLNSIK